MARVLAALLVSFVTGAALAVAMFTFDPIERYVRPAIRLLMAVPVVSWVLFAILWFKGIEFRIVFVLIVVCAPGLRGRSV
jgi:NitT/TauT family transport system permease protein